MVAFRRPKCLKDILVHSELKTPVNEKGCVKCTDKRCRVCDYLVEGTRFISGVTGKSYVINFDMGCNSDHVIYLISCARCAMQYVGSTVNKFRIRFNNHKSRLNSHVKLTAENRVKDDIIGVLRGSDCKYRESADKLKKSKILITCQKNTFGELSSKILLKPSGILLFSGNSEKRFCLIYYAIIRLKIKQIESACF